MSDALPARRRRRWWPWLLLLLALLLVGVWTLPASLAYRLIADRLQDVAAAGLSGTLWEGRASSLLVKGRDWGQLDWRLQRWPLLQGRTEVTATLKGTGLDLNGQIDRAADRALQLRQVAGQLDAAWLGPALGLPLFIPTGQIELALPLLQVDAEGRPQAVDGQAIWRNAGFTGITRASLGELLLTLQGSGGVIDGQISHRGQADLRVEGDLQMRGQQYRLTVRLWPDPSQPELINALQWVGQPMADGGRLLIVEGVVQGWSG
ncbi:MAG: type II secretion system protein N [Lysobacterales bacterium]